MQDLMTINVVIGDRTYRIKIEKQDEEVVRRTLKTINDKIIEYKTQFAGRDMQDYIAMVLLWYATQAVREADRGANTAHATGPVLDALGRIEQQLDKAL
jgi:cell division protein ZapA